MGLSKFIREHWLPVAVVTSLVAAAAIVTIFGGFTHKTIPEFFKAYWPTGIPDMTWLWPYILAVAIGALQVVLIIVLWSARPAASAFDPNNMLEDARQAVKKLEVCREALKATQDEHARQLREATAETIQVRSELDEKLKAMELVRGNLHDELRTAKGERDGFQQAWLTCKQQFALAKVGWFGERTRNPAEPWAFFAVTIQLADPKDFNLAKKVAALLKNVARFDQTEIDQTLRPLPPAEEYKVLFAYDRRRPRFDPLFEAIAEGNLLECSVGVDHKEDTGLWIWILPS